MLLVRRRGCDRERLVDSGGEYVDGGEDVILSR